MRADQHRHLPLKLIRLQETPDSKSWVPGRQTLRGVAISTLPRRSIPKAQGSEWDSDERTVPDGHRSSLSSTLHEADFRNERRATETFFTGQANVSMVTNASGL